MECLRSGRVKHLRLRAWLKQQPHIIPEPQGCSLSSQAPWRAPLCMNDCIVELGAGRDGPPRPPVPGNSVESKQARQGASLCRWGAFLHFSSVSETTGMRRWSSQSPTHIAHHLQLQPPPRNLLRAQTKCFRACTFSPNRLDFTV